MRVCVCLGVCVSLNIEYITGARAFFAHKKWSIESERKGGDNVFKITLVPKVLLSRHIIIGPKSLSIFIESSFTHQFIVHCLILYLP